jgi:hypothetical protein
MVGQAWMIEQLSQIAPVITVEGWQKDGNGTSQIREHLRLAKNKSDKALQAPETHAVDAVAIAALHFVQYKPFHTANTRGCIWVGEVGVTPAVFKVISNRKSPAVAYMMLWRLRAELGSVTAAQQHPSKLEKET